MLHSRTRTRVSVGWTTHGRQALLSTVIAGGLSACANIEPGEVGATTEALSERASAEASAKLITNPAVNAAIASRIDDSVLRISIPKISPLVCSVPVDGTRPDPTLVNTDPFVLSRFPLDKVYQQLISGAGAASQTPTQLYQQMWDSLDTASNARFTSAAHCDDNGTTVNGFSVDCPRPETKLKNTSPAKFTPVALFNRFDLSPSDGANCGEYRIVYAMNGSGSSGPTYPGIGIIDPPVLIEPGPRIPVGPGPIEVPVISAPIIGVRSIANLSATSAVLNPAAASSLALRDSVVLNPGTTLPIKIKPIIPLPPVVGRSFIIFEGILPNPNPSCGIEMCRPVVKLWEDLATQNTATAAGQQALADGLEQLYFKGLPGFEPVVHPGHYGQTGGGGYGERSGGQIRVNMFVDFQNWQLREFHLVNDCSSGSCKLRLDPVTVKTNPQHEMFDATNLDARAQSFRSVFPAETKALSTDNVAQLSMHIDDKFNAGQSTAGPLGRDDYEDDFNGAAPPTTFSAAIDSQLLSPAVARPDLTAADITRRATTQSCAGCHEVSNNQHLGGTRDPIWPASRRFVHVDESGFLSPALWCTFLPARKTTLDVFASSAPRACPPPTPIPRAAVPTLIIDPEIRVTELPSLDSSKLSISGKVIGPN